MTRGHFIDLLNRLGDLVETTGKVVVCDEKSGEQKPVRTIDVNPNTQQIRLLV